VVGSVPMIKKNINTSKRLIILNICTQTLLLEIYAKKVFYDDKLLSYVHCVQ
jgi:hypothetical protein